VKLKHSVVERNHKQKYRVSNLDEVDENLSNVVPYDGKDYKLFNGTVRAPVVI
jgi:hypothetical protein